MIRATNLWGYDTLVRSLGADPLPFRSRYGIEAGIEEQDDTFVEFTAVAKLFETTAIELGCPDFGLRLVEWQGLGILGPVAVMARNATTVGDGLIALGRYLHAHSPALHLTADVPAADGSIAFRFEIQAMPAPELRQAYELSLANGAQIVRMLSGGDGVPDQVAFLHHRIGPLDSYRAALGSDPIFCADWCGFVMGPTVLSRPIDTADPQTRRLAAAYLEANYAEVGTGLTDRVSELVRRLLPTGHYSAAAVADELHLHLRTLQRQLAGENTTYAEILEKQRRDLALHYLAEPKLQMGQIAILLGYTEQSALNRAFRRWFGTSPRGYRRVQRP